MAVLAVSQIYWAVDIESKVAVGKLHEYFADLQKQLIDTVAMVRSKTVTNLDRITVKALIVIDVHAKDVVEHLVKSKMSDVNDFQWMRQLRYYMNGETVDVRIINACVPYAYEYLGNSDRLVITPLTDRCYITLMSAYQLHLNGAPEGEGSLKI
jgi:dynein heavy chain